MNPDSKPPAPADSGLQFDRAEFKEGAALNCVVCKAPVQGEFFQINGQTVCPSCRKRADSEIGGGTPISRFATAFGAGVLASAAGVFVYWAIARLLGGGWGLVAVLIGWMVGYCVRWGSRGRGGLPYQLLAVILTYCAIAGSHVQRFLPRNKAETDVLDYLTAFGQAAASPWTDGPRNIFFWIVLAIGLYQAWQMNRETKLQISGPFFTRQSPPPAAS